MKILEIWLKNLNSLRGEWHIDLSHGPYVTDGIFAITGPTGAGKTTIFDAICLALYAKTPRLGGITQGSNEIMSKHTKDCYARVTLEARGKKYLCTWKQHISASGNLQPAKHIISELPSGTVVQMSVKDITGMDFKQFTQAVMLEQGGFDAFLKAKPSERSQILETLTGTEIYGRISTAVYERTGDEAKKLADLQAEIDAKKPHDDFGSEEEIMRMLEAKRREFSELDAEHHNLKEAVDWLNNIVKLERALAQADESISQQRKRADLFSADRRKLEAALRAGELHTEYIALKSKREQFTATKERHDKHSRQIEQNTAERTVIETETLPHFQAELERRTRNITESPEIIHTRALELMNRYIDIRKKGAVIAREEPQAQRAFAIAEAAFNSANEAYTECLKRHEEIVLASARHNLKPGEPCPVCGSREHPGIVHADTGTSSGVSAVNLEAANKKLREAHTRYTAAHSAFTQCAKAKADNAQEAAEAREAVMAVIEPLGIFDASTKDCRQILSRLNGWLNDVRALTTKVTELTQKRELLSTGIDTMQKSVAEDRTALEAMTGTLENMEADFRVHLTERGFDDENTFQASLMLPAELSRLQDEAKRIDDGMRDLLAVQADRTERLASERAKGLTAETLETLTTKYSEQEKQLEFLRKAVYGYEHALTERRNIQAELQGLEERKAKQKAVYDNWSALNKLIGQKDGGKFRKFAQRITLGMMTAGANIQLQRMSGRYSLTVKPGENEDLELCVVDSEQAGEVRPTENLSGGERFLVSLALALGLSQISGSRARVDSLFLDEGFGSLDEDSLNTALEALGEIRREGRMIGIISHVAALRERIAARINVIPKHEGTSILEGPGCSRM